MMRGNTCVVHVVRNQNGLIPFVAFLDSYRRLDAGLGHDLLIVYKGFGDGKLPEAYRRQLSDLAYHSLCVEDIGKDIRPYFVAAKEFDYEYFCFFNSFCVILGDGWLGKMYQHVRRDGIGVVGATGSYESISARVSGPIPQEKRRGLSKVMPKLIRHLHFAFDRRGFPPFPNPHLRLTGFMISRRLMLALKTKTLRRMKNLYLLESGKRSMTRQLLAMNLRALVVGRNGEAYEADQWPQSRTFRSGQQENVLIADNQTRAYAEADPQTKATLAWNAWGNAARESE